MKKFLPQLFLLLFVSPVAFCQSTPGPWTFPDADTTYPRSIIHSKELSGVRATLSFGINNDLFDAVYLDAMSTPPSANNDIDSRRTRARIAKNAAFVLLIGLKHSGGSMTPLNNAEKDYFKNTSKTLLEQINTYVSPMSTDSPGNFDLWQWTSKEIIDFVTAYDLLRGAGITESELGAAKNAVKTYAGNLYYESTKPSLGASFFELNKNNHALMTAGSLGLAAVVLNDLQDTLDRLKPINWINAAMWNIHNVVWWEIRKQSKPGTYGGYAEGTYYFKYAFVNLLPFFRSMGYFVRDTTLVYEFRGISRKIRHPWYDTNYVKLYDWLAAIRLPDGRMPALEDSYTYRCFPELSIVGKAKYNWPLALSQLAPEQDNSLNAQLVSVYDMRANYIAANIPVTSVPDSLFRVMPDAGIAVFRSSWDSSATYLALTGKNGSALASADAHNQADDGSFLMMVNGQTMALSPGYLSYEMRDTVSSAHTHNMLLVNGEGPLAGRPGKANGANSYIEKAFSSDVQDYAELRTAYVGTSINRKVLFVRKKYFFMIDHLAAPAAQQYSYLLHGYGLEGGNQNTTGTFTDLFSNNRAAWKRKNSGLYAIVQSDVPVIFNKRPGKHEYTYQVIQNHTCMDVKTTATNAATFLTCLQPFINIATDTFPVISLPLAGATACKVSDGSYTDVIISRSATGVTALLAIPKSVTGLNHDYSTDGQLFWVSEKSGTALDLFMYKGHVLHKDADTLVYAANAINLQYVQTGTKSYKGYCGDTGWVNFHTGEYPYGLKGGAVLNVSYNTTTKIASAYFATPGTFHFILDDTKIGVGSVQPNEPSMSVYPNPASNSLHITSNRMMEKGASLSLRDITGKVVVEHILACGTHEVSLVTEGLANGMYIVVLSTAHGMSSKPVRMVINR